MASENHTPTKIMGMDKPVLIGIASVFVVLVGYGLFELIRKR